MIKLLALVVLPTWITMVCLSIRYQRRRSKAPTLEVYKFNNKRYHIYNAISCLLGVLMGSVVAQLVQQY